MKIINGHNLKQMIISGANNLYNCYPEIDALNVFPVPDGDTGTNMNLTMTSGSKEVMNIDNNNIGDVAKMFSKGLLMGARGNSGVILSQIFRGLAVGLEGKSKVDSVGLSEALINAKDMAYKAVMKPVEGTILTVIRESAVALKQFVDKNDKIPSIKESMEVLIKEAKESLERTPELLPVLKEVGVVDSGGAGLVKIFEGFASAINNKMVERIKPSFSQSETINVQSHLENDEFGYCTEFILDLDTDNVEKKKFYEKRFIGVLENHGNSIVVVQDENLVKVHIHTLRPGSVFNYAQQFGEFVSLKVENMQLQHSHLVESAHIKEKKNYALISVAVGEGVKQMFKDLRVDYIVSGGQTMNPSTEDFVEAIKKANAKNIFIMPNNPNIIMAAKQACDVVEDVNCKVVPTKTIPQGMLSCMMFNPDANEEENFGEMKEAIKRVKSGQVTFAIKDTTIDGLEIKENYFMGLKEKNIISCKESKVDATIELIDTMIDDDSEIITIITGEDVTKKESDQIVKHITKKYPIEVELKSGNQPVYSFIIGVE